jgi:outer membrane usher protein
VRRIRRAIAGVMSCLVVAGMLGTGARAQQSSPAPPASSRELLVLGALLNTVSKGDLFVLRTAGGDILAKVEDLKTIGLRLPEDLVPLTIDGELYVSLRSVQGLRYQVRQPELVLDIHAEPKLLPASTIDLQSRRRANIVLPTGPSGFFNYALQASTLGGNSRRAYALASEAGLRYGQFIAQSDATSLHDGLGNYRMVRLMSRATHDDLESLQRLVIGDFYITPGELGNSVNVGGISLTKLYALDPYLVRQPLGNLKAQVTVPSDVEVIVDGQRVRIERVPPGEFEIRDLYSYGGARSVQLVLRDAFGRVQQLDYSAYFSDQPLRRGLHEYRYSAGQLRRNYGIVSNNYGPAAFSAFHRYGISDAVTLGLRAEGRREAYNGGPFGTLVLGTFGVVSFSASASRAEGGPGWAAAATYNYQRRNFSFGASARRDSAGYAMLTDPLILYNRRTEASVYGSYYQAGLGTVSLSHSLLTTHGAIELPLSGRFGLGALEGGRVTALNYSLPLVSGRASLSASLSHIKDRNGSHNEVMTNLTVYLDRDHTFQAGARHSGDGAQGSLQLIRNPPIGEGLGYDIAAGHSRDFGDEQSQLRMAGQLNTRSALWRGEVERQNTSGRNSEGYRLSVAGGVALVGNGLYVSRPISDSFALVQVGELAGVPVSVNGTTIGETNARGRLLVTPLNAYYDNEVAIGQDAIPIDYSVARVSQRVAPLYRTGVTVDFGVSRVQVTSGHLVRQSAKGRRPLELAELIIRMNDKDIRNFSGRGGEIYLENAPPGRYAGRAASAEGQCVFELDIPSRTDTFVQLGDIICK